MRFLNGAIFSFLFGILIITPMVCTLYTNQAMKKLDENERKVNAILPRFIADLKIIEAQPPFPEWTRNSNAGPLLRKWIPTPEGFENIDSPGHTALRALIKKYPKAHMDENQFKAYASDPLLAQVDTRWMQELKKYDHWNIYSHPKWKEQFAKLKDLNSIGRIGVYASLPVPEMGEFRGFAFANFVKAYNQGKALEGLATYRKTSEMIHSTGTLIGNMVAIAMLKTEMSMTAFSGAMAWPIVPPDTIEAYKKVSWAWAGVLHVARKKEFPKELTAYLKPQLGMCGGSGEGISTLNGLSDFLQPQFPFEMDFTDALASERKMTMHTQEICGQQELYGFLDRVPASANPLLYKDAGKVYRLFSGFDGPDLLPNPARIPFVRRAVGLTILTIAMPDYMNFYKEEGH